MLPGHHRPASDEQILSARKATIRQSVFRLPAGPTDYAMANRLSAFCIQNGSPPCSLAHLDLRRIVGDGLSLPLRSQRKAA